MLEFLDRVRETSDSVGTGSTVHLTGAFNQTFLSIDDIATVLGTNFNGRRFSYVIEQGQDFEIQYRQVWDSSGKTLVRPTPRISKIGGVAGTTKLTLTGAQTVRIVVSADDLTRLLKNAKRQAIIYG